MIQFVWLAFIMGIRTGVFSFPKPSLFSGFDSFPTIPNWSAMNGSSERCCFFVFFFIFFYFLDFYDLFASFSLS